MPTYVFKGRNRMNEIVAGERVALVGPTGEGKSTIVRLLKKGLEEYSRTPEGALYTFTWVLEKKGADGQVHTERFPTPMNEDPLLLIPPLSSYFPMLTIGMRRSSRTSARRTAATRSRWAAISARRPG